MNMKAEEVHHVPTCCAACTAPFGQDMKRRCVSAHHSLELSSGDMSQKITLYKHVYHAVLCHCGHDNVASPAAGMGSHIDGRRRNLEMSERCLIGPALAAYIANLSIKYRLSRSKIGELLYESFGLALSTATIERCIHELGLASEPVVKRLIDEIQQSGDPDQIVNVDETPWYQKGQFLWLWVMTNKFTTVFRIGSRRKEELVELIGESFMGWMITDGYRAYRDHLRRQRCLAHLIRKGLALAEGFYGKGSEFGRRLVAQLRGLIQRVHDGVDADTPAMKRFMSRLKFNCECNRYADEKKVRQLAGEILNDWDAVVAFVHNPELPPTNNDAERALRHAIIARKISFGTRTDEGSRFYAAALSVITTCRQRGVKTLGYIASLIAAARAGLSVPPMPDIPDIPTRAVA
jgi:IS1 family transposase